MRAEEDMPEALSGSTAVADEECKGALIVGGCDSRGRDTKRAWYYTRETKKYKEMKSLPCTSSWGVGGRLSGGDCGWLQEVESQKIVYCCMTLLKTSGR